MKYYKLASDLNMVGTAIQIQQAEYYGPFLGDEHFDPFADSPLKLAQPLHLILEKKARPTQLLSAAFIPESFLIIDEGLLSQMKNFNLPAYQEWPLKIIHLGNKGSLDNYKLFHIDYSSSVVDFSLSTFYDNKTGYKEPVTKNYIRINNLQEFKKAQSEAHNMNKQIGSEKIVINFEPIKYDLIRVNTMIASGLSGYYASENIKNELSYRYPGLLFKTTDNLNNKVRIVVE